MAFAATLHGFVFVACATYLCCVEAVDDCLCPNGQVLQVLPGFWYRFSCAATGPKCEDKMRLAAPNAVYCRSDKNCPLSMMPSADYHAPFPCQDCGHWCTEKCRRDPKCVGMAINGDNCWLSEQPCRDDQLEPPMGAYYCVKVCEVPRIENGKVERISTEFGYVSPDFMPVTGRIGIVCNGGFVLRGPATFVCSSDERWEPSSRRRRKNEPRQQNRCRKPMKLKMSKCVDMDRR